VDRWVEANPGTTAVRGWVTYADYGIARGLAAHSVVQGTDGQLFDITPLESEYIRSTMQFIRHVGDEQTFFEMEKLKEIRCPCELKWPFERYTESESPDAIGDNDDPCG
jgi:hypothetical protein